MHAAQGAVAVTGSGVKVETSEARMSTSTIDGLQVTRTFTFADKSGAVIVVLGPSAVFMLSFNGISDDEGLKAGTAIQLEIHPGRGSEIVL